MYSSPPGRGVIKPRFASDSIVPLYFLIGLDLNRMIKEECERSLKLRRNYYEKSMKYLWALTGREEGGNGRVC